MTKIRAEIDVIDSNYCENEDITCPMCLVGDWGQYSCALFDNVLEIDEENHHFCKRCEKCKQAEVEEMTEQKKIEEILSKLQKGEFCLPDCYGCCGDPCLDITCNIVVDNFIKELHNADYRKADEVRKETAKEFAEKLKQKYAQSCSEYYPELIILTAEQLEELLKEYEK